MDHRLFKAALTAYGALALILGPFAFAGPDEAKPPQTQAACVLASLRNGELALNQQDLISPSLIHYRVYGKNHQETIVLIHGLGSDLHTWDRIAPKLAKKYRVITYDQRGHGDTPALNDNFSSATMATDLKTSSTTCMSIAPPSSATRWEGEPRFASPTSIQNGHSRSSSRTCT